MVEVQVRRDRKRGCGWRKEKGLYLVADGVAASCGKLPLPIERCPTCSHGIKFTRGFTWVDGDVLFQSVDCKATRCLGVMCPMSDRAGKTVIDNETVGVGSLGRCGLIWIGEAFYKTPGDWLQEANEQGISRRLSTVPNDFKVGETWVLVAHLKAIAVPCTMKNVRECEVCKGKMWHYTPAVFQVFRPQAIEYVVTGNETEEELEKLVKRGLTPVRIERVEDQPELISEAAQ